MTTLFKASRQWATRPADQKFASIQEMHDICTGYMNQAAEAITSYDKLSVEVKEINETREPVLISDSGTTARFTHFSFGQIATRVGAPASYLRELPANLAADNLNHGLSQIRHTDKAEAKEAKLMFHQNGSLLVRSFTGKGYTRIWNSEITQRLLSLTAQKPEWQPAPAAFDGSRGLYASDHDMFAFLVDNDRRIFENAADGGLSRGFFVWNSEVGDKSFGIETFLYKYVCGNHMVWGAENVKEVRIPHIGNADSRAFAGIEAYVTEYSNQRASDDEAKIEKAMTVKLGNTKDEVLDRIFGLRTTLAKKEIEAGYNKAVEHDQWYGDPKSVWGMVNGITEVARDLPFADYRVNMERAASKIMRIAF